jgi:hypothetical protein
METNRTRKERLRAQRRYARQLRWWVQIPTEFPAIKPKLPRWLWEEKALRWQRDRIRAAKQMGEALAEKIVEGFVEMAVKKIFDSPEIQAAIKEGRNLQSDCPSFQTSQSDMQSLLADIQARCQSDKRCASLARQDRFPLLLCAVVYSSLSRVPRLDREESGEGAGIGTDLPNRPMEQTN